EDCNFAIDTVMKHFGDEIRSRLLPPAAHLVTPVRSKQRDLDVRPEPVRAKSRLLVLSRQKRYEDVGEVICASGEHGGDGIFPKATVMGPVHATEMLADGRPNNIPNGRTGKLRKLAGENGVEGQGHLHQIYAGAGV